MMKDEAPYLLEWVAHHLGIGFTDILVYTNDCTDGTDDMLIRLEELGLCHHRRNKIPKGIKPQPSAIKYAQKEKIVQNSDWVLLFDADEFLCITHGDGTLDGMLTAAGRANGIVITWRIFGSGNIVDWSHTPVTEQYVQAAPPQWNKGWGVKTLFKFDPEYWKLGIHRPSIKAKHLDGDFPDSVRWLNGSGAPMEDYFKFRGWRSIRRTVGFEWAQMNHYAVKSIDAYALRKFRGNVNDKKDKYNADYWALQDRNEVRDTRILRHAAKRAAIMTELLKDPVLKRLHETALDAAEARLDSFRKTPEYEELKAGLITASKVPLAQVSAKPPKARDPSKIAALMSAVERKEASRPKSDRRHTASTVLQAGADDLYLTQIDMTQDPGPISRYSNHDVALPADPRLFQPNALEAIEAGKFQRREARHIGALLSGKDRLLDIGAGIAFLPILALRQHAGLVVLAQEERTPLAKAARQLAADHDLADTSRLKIVEGPLFFAGDTNHAAGLQALITDFNPTVLRLSDGRITAAHLAALTTQNLTRVVLAVPDPEPYADMLGTKGFAPLDAPSPVFDRMPKT